MKFLFDEESFSYETLRTTGFANFEGADLGEVLVTAAAIPERDEAAWHRSWKATGDRARGLADDALAAGDRVGARGALLRASNYYRTADFYLRDDADNDPEVTLLSQLSRDAFARAVELMERPVRSVSIPYEDTTLPGYLFLVDDSGTPRPTLIYNSGFDSTLEESYFVLAAASNQRGYNVLAFDGPGQGAAVRDQRLRFRPDWEAVVTPVVDFALTQPEIDGARLGLFGYSLGGLLVARAAAFEHRLAALILNDGLYSFYDTNIKAVPPFVAEWILDGQDEAANAVAALVRNASTSVSWGLRNGMWTFGASSAAEYVRMTKPYTLEGVAHQIECPTLVCDAEEDYFFRGQPQRIFDALTCEKEMIRFTAAEGAGEHCHMGALSYFHQRLFSWLGRTMPAVQHLAGAGSGA
ncbi:alpha/beta hydrolase family protein [Streptomyces sp. NPDC088725]|uniref:alpha/beta hydrolase family protein n=1 Tax=Streptomyces sp. NPDC088725 TaxID=3365873 RepID=UPI0037F4948A